MSSPFGEFLEKGSIEMKIKNIGKQGAFQWWILTKRFSIFLFRSKDFETKRRIEIVGKDNPFLDKSKTYIDIYL